MKHDVDAALSRVTIRADNHVLQGGHIASSRHFVLYPVYFCLFMRHHLRYCRGIRLNSPLSNGTSMISNIIRPSDDSR